MSLFDQFNWQGQNGFPYWMGYYWLGPIQIPPLPSWIGMTDRATGVVYYLTLGNQQHLKLTTAAPSQAPIRVYAPYDGPFIGQYFLRMGVSNGNIVIDQFPMDSGPGPFVRNLNNNQQIAGLFGINQNGGSGFDHIAILLGSASQSVFALPKTTQFDQFPPGDDVMGA